MHVPAVLIEGCVLTFVRDAAGTEFEKQARDGAASRTAIQPESKGSFLWFTPRLKEPTNLLVTDVAIRRLLRHLPEEQMLAAGYVQVSGMLLHGWIAKRWLSQPKLILGKL